MSANRRILAIAVLVAAVAVSCGIWTILNRGPSTVRTAGSPASAAPATVELATRTLCATGFPVRFCEHQRASVRGTAAYALAVREPRRKVAAIKAVRDCGARVIGVLPPNALLVETSVFALGKLSVDEHFIAAAEWLPEDKLDARLKGLSATETGSIEANVVVLAADDVQRIAEFVQASGGERISDSLNGKTSLTVRMPRKLIAELIARGDVRYLEPFSRPRPHNDLAVGETAMNVSSVWRLHGLTGEGQVISTSDTGIDTGDLATMHSDLRGGICGIRVNSNCHTNDIDGHGTHTAGSIIGDGTLSGGAIRGVAYGAKLWAWFCARSYGSSIGISVPSDCSELFRPDATNHIACVHSASWGDDSGLGNYTTQCAAIDDYVWDHPDFLPVFSAGNDGSASATISPPATAKNVLAVGATQNARVGHDGSRENGDPSQVTEFSSRGPCADGRIKPDLVAPGAGIVSTRALSLPDSNFENYGVYSNSAYAYMSGTSMSAPLVAGAAALVREWLVKCRGCTNVSPSAALVRAVLAGGARGESTPDNDAGWGRVDLGESLFPSNRSVRIVDRIPFAADVSYACEVTLTNAAPFDVQLAWVDHAATAGSGKTLVNDLDLVVSNRQTGAVWKGNDVADGDHLNSQEAVRIATAEPGVYVVLVKSYDIAYDHGQGGAAALYLRGAFEETAVSESVSFFEIESAEPSAAAVNQKVGVTNEFAITVAASAELSVSYAWTIDGTAIADAVTNRWSYAPNWDDRGSHVIQVKASSDAGQSQVRTWTVSVWGEVSVDADLGNDESATGECERPYRTLAAALANAVAGDVVRAGPGCYAGGLSAPSAAVRIESRDGAECTFIDGGGTNRCYDGSANDSTVLSGFTLTNGWLEGENYYAYGAGAYGGILSNCVIVGCCADYYGCGGGAAQATLYDCQIRDCFAGMAGGGIYDCVATGCTFRENCAGVFTSSYGGGAAYSTLDHCTVHGNVAVAAGGGVDADCECTDCIVWDNELETGKTSNWEQYIEVLYLGWKNYSTKFSYSCTAPEGYRDGGSNTNAEPRWVNAAEGDFRLGVGSPCLGTASDGGNMGAWQGTGVPGHIVKTSVEGAGEITPEMAFVADGATATFTASTHHPFQGWSTNGVAVSGVWTNEFVWTDIHGDGVITASFGSTNFFVDAAYGDDASNGWSRASAKRTMQAAVDVAADGETVTVASGVYTGTVVTTAAKIDIVAAEGPGKTTIVGEGGTNRCFNAYLNSASRLIGFTLADGASEKNYGGGVFYGTLSNCVIRNCHAALGGGGAYYATLCDCIIVDCTTDGQGGGVSESVLVNCTLRGNRAGALRQDEGYNYIKEGVQAGGAVDYLCVCTNTLLQGNFGPSYGEDNWERYNYQVYGRRGGPMLYVYAARLYWCSALPYNAYSVCNLTNDPQFVSSATDDVRIYETSPCIGSGYAGADIGALTGTCWPRVLPDLAPGATGAEVSNTVSAFGFADAAVARGIGTNATTYVEFQTWSTNGLKALDVYLSQRAFDSFRMRDIFYSPTLLCSAADVIELGALLPQTNGTASAVVRFFDGDREIPLRPSSLFGEMALVGESYTNLAAAAEYQVTSSQEQGRDSVTLTVAPSAPAATADSAASNAFKQCYLQLVLP